MVVNGKIITDIDLQAALETHRRTEALATLVLLPNVVRERFSVVETENGLVKRFGGMPVPQVTQTTVPSSEENREFVAGPNREPDNEPERPLHSSEHPQTDEESSAAERAPLMFTGIQILEPRIFDYIPRGVFSHSTVDVYPQAIANGERIAAHVGAGHWYELSTLQRYLDISLRLLADQGRDTFAGARSNIAAGAEVHDSILWDDVEVEPGATVERSILADGVRITSRQRIKNAVVVRSSLVQGVTPPAKAPKGVFQGQNFVVSLAQ